MKLDPNCVRDLLLALEDCEPITEAGVLSSDFSLKPVFEHKRLQKYDHAQLCYTFRMLVDAGYIACKINYIKNGFLPFLVHQAHHLSGPVHCQYSKRWCEQDNRKIAHGRQLHGL
ncbi:MAG: DUF2513 domain-containing protein [Christensenellales bacterium]